MLRLLRISGRCCRTRRRSLLRQQRAGGGVGQNVFAFKSGVGIEQRRRIGLLLLQLAQIDLARQLRQRIGRVQLASGGIQQRMIIRAGDRRRCGGRRRVRRKLFHQAVPDFVGDWRGGWFFGSGNRGCRRSNGGDLGHRLSLWRGVLLQRADFNLVIVDAEHVAILQFNLAAALQRNVVQQHAGDVAAVGDAAFAVSGNMHDSLQAGNGALFVRQHQVVVHAAADGAARRQKIATALRRNLAAFIFYNGKSHKAFLLIRSYGQTVELDNWMSLT